jgi:hypothetical protein
MAAARGKSEPTGEFRWASRMKTDGRHTENPDLDPANTRYGNRQEDIVCETEKESRDWLEKHGDASRLYGLHKDGKFLFSCSHKRAGLMSKPDRHWRMINRDRRRPEVARKRGVLRPTFSIKFGQPSIYFDGLHHEGFFKDTNVVRYYSDRKDVPLPPLDESSYSIYPVVIMEDPRPRSWWMEQPTTCEPKSSDYQMVRQYVKDKMSETLEREKDHAVKYGDGKVHYSEKRPPVCLRPLIKDYYGYDTLSVPYGMFVHEYMPTIQRFTTKLIVVQKFLNTLAISPLSEEEEVCYAKIRSYFHFLTPDDVVILKTLMDPPPPVIKTGIMTYNKFTGEIYELNMYCLHFKNTYIMWPFDFVNYCRRYNIMPSNDFYNRIMDITFSRRDICRPSLSIMATKLAKIEEAIALPT